MSDEHVDREATSFAAGRPGVEPIYQFSYYAVDWMLERAKIPQWRREQLERMRKGAKRPPASRRTPAA